MTLILNSAVQDIAIILTTLIIGIVTFLKWRYTYWKRRNVPYIQPKLILGTSENPLKRKEYIGRRMKKFYDEFKSKGHKHGGIFLFTRPAYLPVDLQYVKNIMSKDFQYFNDHGTYYNEKDDPLSAHLFSIGGQKWRDLRTKLTPAFTSGKIKIMFQAVLECGEQLINAINEYYQVGEPIEIKDIAACYTTDVIGSCVFGIECNSFKGSESDFRKYARKIFAVTKFQAFKNAIAIANHNLGRFLRICMFASDVRHFFMKAIKDTVEYREKNNFVRKDFMQILIDLKNSNQQENVLTIEEVAAQVFVFFFAGYETSSTTMSFCLYELSLNTRLQDRVREEINAVLEKHGGNLSYEALLEMKYLGQVIDETLRKHPPASVAPRKCVQDYRIPDTDITIEKGTTILIPVLALHTDPEYFPDPNTFDPERFNEENKRHIPPFAYIPFGEGPRICIGSRFGLMQTKVGVVLLLKNYKFSINKKTDTPLTLEPSIFVLTVKGGIWLDMEKVDK